MLVGLMRVQTLVRLPWEAARAVPGCAVERQVLDQLEAMRSSIEQFIRQDQKNYNAKIQLQLVEMEEKTVFNKTDHMQSVMKRNKEVQHLISNLQLELR